jgi:hypothetical protein
MRLRAAAHRRRLRVSLGQDRRCEAVGGSADRCPVSAYDEGEGQAAVIIVGGAGDNGRGHARLAAKLRSTNRVLQLIRRQYRSDLAAWRPVNATDEAADVVALARTALTRAISSATPPVV